MKNREIKFRAWDKTESKMLHSITQIWWYEGGDISRLTYKKATQKGDWIPYWKDFRPGKVILMQYTGLKDKNGKEIYEGDVITRLIEPTLGRNYNEVIVIEWEICEDDEYGNHRSGFDISGHSELFEILGNIYSNPELIKQ